MKDDDRKIRRELDLIDVECGGARIARWYLVDDFMGRKGRRAAGCLAAAAAAPAAPCKCGRGVR